MDEVFEEQGGSRRVTNPLFPQVQPLPRHTVSGKDQYPWSMFEIDDSLMRRDTDEVILSASLSIQSAFVMISHLQAFLSKQINTG